MSPYAIAAFSRGVPFPKAVSREISLTDTDTVALSSENVTAGTKLQNDRWTKADKLEVSYTNEAVPEIKLVETIAIVSRTKKARSSRVRGFWQSTATNALRGSRSKMVCRLSRQSAKVSTRPVVFWCLMS
jgi:hypothetical protein